MRRNTINLLAAASVLCFGLALGACSDDDGDVCSGISNCSVAGTSCDGDTLLTCGVNVDGCLVESETDCTTSNTVCDDTGAAAMCVDDSCDDAECVGHTDGDSFCTVDDAIDCDEDTNGCLIATVVDCTATSEVCNDNTGTAECVAPSCDDAECVGHTAGDSFCTVDDAIDCDEDTNGCLIATVVDCTATSEVCNDNTGTAECVAPSCDDAECVGHTDGDSFCAGNTSIICDEDTNGCLLATTLDCTTSSEICNDNTGSAVCEAPPTGCGDGTLDTASEQCDDGANVPGDGCDGSCNVEFGYECDGASPTVCAAYPNLGTFAGGDAIPNQSCTAAMVAGEHDGYMVTFTENVLLSGTLTATDQGDVDFFVYDNTGTAVFSSEAVGDETFTAAPLIAGTYMISVLAYSDTNQCYTLTLSTTAAGGACGDGVLDTTFEECDDGANVAGDGCSDTCTVESGYECDGASPTVCTAYPDLGSFAGGDAIPDQSCTNAMLAGEFDGYMITFSENVLLSGTLTAFDQGDVDFYVLDNIGTVVFSSAAVGDETFSDAPLLAGTYTVIVYAYSDTNQCYTLTLSTVAAGTCGDGSLNTAVEECDDNGTQSGDGCSDTCTVEPGYACDGASPTVCTAIICGDGTLDTGFEECDDNGTQSGDGCSDTCTVEFGYECDGASPTVCTAIPSLGSFAAGDAIPNESCSGLMADLEEDLYMITFTTNVLLSGTLIANGTGDDPDFYFIDDTGSTVFNSIVVGDEAFVDEPITAGTYMIRIRAWGDLTDCYTLALTTQ